MRKENAQGIRPANKRKKTVDPRDPRDELLDAAIDLFARYGFEPVSTGAVAKAAGYTQSMVHYHFGSKLALWQAAIDRLMRERGVVLPITRLDLQDLDPLARLKVIVRKFMSVNASDPNLTRILIHEGMVMSPRLRWIADRHMAAGYRMFDKAVTEAIEAKLIKPLSTVAITNIIVSACTMSSSLNCLVDTVYDTDTSTPAFLQSFSDALIEILFRGLELRS